MIGFSIGILAAIGALIIVWGSISKLNESGKQTDHQIGILYAVQSVAGFLLASFVGGAGLAIASLFR